VQGARYSESEVETSTATVELESSTTALELEMDAARLELETGIDCSRKIVNLVS
jgi:hypothetical protein